MKKNIEWPCYTHLDGKVLERIIGFKNNYNGAMAALDRYYNNHSRIVAVCMKEIRALPHIAVGNYKALVSYWMCIVNNHT